MRGFYHPDMENAMEFEGARIAALEEKARSSARRLDRLERLADEIHTQNERLACLAVQLEHLTDMLTKQEARLGEIERIPAKRFSRLVSAIVTALASVIVGGVLTSLF